MSFSGGGSAPALKAGGDKTGRLYLTTHRKIFNNKKSQDLLKSFSFPFVALRDVELEQPIFGANYIKGKVLAQPDGGFQVPLISVLKLQLGVWATVFLAELGD